MPSKQQMNNLLGLGKTSRVILSACHPDLQKIVEHVAQWFPLKVLECHRDKDKQAAAFAAGTSSVEWPKSNHNTSPSTAVDVAPIKWSRELGSYVDWKDWRYFFALAGAILATARFLGIRVIWGHDWDADWDVDEHKLKDGPHFELLLEGEQK